MNKQCYKVIFNKKRGCMMAVAENVNRDGKSVQDSGAASVQVTEATSVSLGSATVSLIKFSLMLALGTAAILPAYASDIVADKSAPRNQQAVILQTANGLPQVNIQTPSTQGVSVNQFTQFNVDEKGAILNNSRTSTQTQLGGWIQGNPYLARGEARVIVNQINSSHPSLLNGYIEVGGKRAEVVMANPSGIRVNGGGFVNAASATLTSGVPILNNGNLTGFDVSAGKVVVEGKGLDTSDADYTRILSRAAEINAGIWGKDIKIVAGKNRLSADGSIVSSDTSPPLSSISDGMTSAPAVAIDTAALGGMYAGKITLISTDKGAEIRNKGQIFAAAGGVTLSADGKLGNSGSIAASDKTDAANNARNDGSSSAVSIQATAVQNSGTISAQGKFSAVSDTVANSGSLLSADELKLQTKQQMQNTESGLIQAGRLDIAVPTLGNQGKIAQTGSQLLALETGRLKNAGYIGFPETAKDNTSNNGNNGGTAGNGSSANGSTTNDTSSTAENSNANPSTANGAGTVENGKPSDSSSSASTIRLSDGLIKTAELNNTGRIEANGGIDLTANNGLTNTAELNLNKLKVSGQQLDNRKAKLTAKHVSADVSQFDNREGTFNAVQSLNVQTDTADNRKGILQSAGSFALHSKQSADNRDGKIIVTEAANIQTSKLNNQGGSIDAAEIVLTAQNIDNRQGFIRSDKSSVLQAADGLNNQAGLISSAGSLNIRNAGKNTLDIDNTGGSIVAGKDVSVQAKSLNNDGTLTAARDVSIALYDDFSSKRNIEAGRKLTFTTQGRLKNAHTIQAGDTVSLTAAQIENTATGNIQSEKHTRLNAADGIGNRGLINSNGLTLLHTEAKLDNIGTGKIYGDRVAVAADTLLNREETANGETKAAVIAARERLDIGAREVENREAALIASEGGLFVGGALDEQNQAVGKAKRLDNRSARIEAQGNGKIAVEQLRNVNEHFTTEEYLDSQRHIIHYTRPNEAEPFFIVGQDGTVREEQHDLNFDFYDGRKIHIHKYGANGMWKADYRQSVYKQRIIENRPAEIIVGGNLQTEGADWLNQNSRILVGQTLSGNTAIQNDAAQNTVRTVNDGKLNYASYEKRDGKLKSRSIKFDKGNGDVPSPPNRTEAFTETLSEVRQNAVELKGRPSSATISHADVAVNGQPINRADQVIFKTTAQSPLLPTNSLYTVNPKNAGWLVETDPAFTDYRKWLGSDYMLAALQNDSNPIHKRLGDGYYEQKLVNEQIAKLTGYRRLDGYTNDEAQFKALMDSGITFAKQFQLSPGIALSAEQVARLTSDIVWLEQQTLTLIDGSTVEVLVPKVYLSVKKGDLNAQGSLISADILALDKHGSIINSGTLAGRQIVDISAGDMANSGVIRGGKVVLRADTVNIEGGEVRADTLLAVEADNIRVASTTSTAGDTQNGSTQLDRVAGLYVNHAESGLLHLKANQDIDFVAANLRNEAKNSQTVLSAGNNITLGTVAVANHESSGALSDKNHRHVHQTAEAGTGISASGHITLAAQNTLNIRQARIDSDKGRVALYGQNNVNIEEGRRTLDLDTAFETKSQGIVSRTTQGIHYQSKHNKAVGSVIEGKQVLVDSGKDISLRGSQIVSDKGTQISAKGNIHIDAAESRYQDSTTRTVKKSGLTGGIKGGVVSAGYQKHDGKARHDADVTEADGSMVGSIEGHTVIIAEENLKTSASAVSAGGDMLLQGKKVELGSAYVLENNLIQTENTTRGFNSISDFRPPEYRQAKKFAKAAQKTRQAEGGWLNKSKAWESGHMAAAIEPLMPTAGVSATRNSSRSNDEQKHLRAVGSSVNAGGQIQVRATEDNIDIIGSQVSGTQGLDMQAARDVNIVSAAEPIDNRFNSTAKTSGMMSGSSTFSTFFGNKTDRSRQEGAEVVHNAGTVGSGQGNTRIRAGNAYRQIGSDVLSDGHIDIAAKKINIEAADATYRSDSYHSFTQKGITVGVSSPVITAVETAQAASRSLEQVGESKNKRTNIMAAANAGWQGYQAAQSAQSAVKGTSGGSKGSGAGAVSVSITYSEQRNESESHIQGNRAAASNIRADGMVSLNAEGAGKDSDIHIIGSDVAGKGGTQLLSENNIHLLAAGQNHDEKSTNSQRGWNAGVALSFGDGVSVGITAGGNYGKGYGNGAETTHRHSHIGSQDSQTVIQAKQDTVLKGAQIIGKGVAVDTQNLHIESLQDSAAYNSKQFQGSVQATVGYGFSGSVDYSQSKIKAEHQSVGKQSGIFAGDDGFQVNVKEHTELKGGLITASDTAEQDGKNRLQTATVHSSDLQNFSRYEGESFGIGMSGGVNGKGDQSINGHEKVRRAAQGQNTGNSTAKGEGAKGAKFSASFGYGRDRESESSRTKSGIGTKNIVMTDGKAQQTRTGRTAEQTAQSLYSDIRTETAEEQSGRLQNVFDKERVQKELDVQREVTQEFGKNAPRAVADVADYLGGTKDFQRAEILKEAVLTELSAITDSEKREQLQNALNSIDHYLTENQAAYDTWKEGGIGRSLLHAGVGGLTTGNIGGAIGAGGTSIASPYLDQLSENLSPAGKVALDTLGGVAIGYVFGSNGGAVTGANADWNNRQLHPSEKQLIKKSAEAMQSHVKKTEGKNISLAEAELRLEKQILRWVDKNSFDDITDESAVSVLGMSGNLNGIKWDYRDYAQRYPEAYKDPNLFVNFSSLERDKQLAKLHTGTPNSVIRQREQDNENLAFNLLDFASNMPGGQLGAKKIVANIKQGFNYLKSLKSGTYKEDPALAGIGSINLSSKAAKEDLPSHVSASLGNRKQVNASRGSPIPVPEPVRVNIGNQAVTYKSNPKHTPGQPGFRPNAGIEPKNSLELFENSHSISSSQTVRFARDEAGGIHRFTRDPNNEWHWNGGTRDQNNPLILDNKTKAELRNLGWKGKDLK